MKDRRWLNTAKSQKKFKDKSKKGKQRQSGKSQAKDQRQTVVLMLVSDEDGAISLPYQLWADPIKQLIKQKGSVWCPIFKIWKMSRVQLEYLRRDLPQILTAHYQDPPNFVKMIAEPLSTNLHIGKHHYQTIRYQYSKCKLYERLYPFQRQTLDYCLRRHGRILIGDQMGVGKSFQSLACCTILPEGFPLLIICPSALKQVWRDQVGKWLKDYVSPLQVVMIKKGTVKQSDLDQARVVIVSYQVASKLLKQLERYKTVICDQAHYLKNPQTARCSHLIPFLKDRKRILLLTGTPALAKPRELFNIFTILRPDIFSSLQEFGQRYCFKRPNPWTHKLQFQGAKNLAELHYILKKAVMIRRLKSQVLPQLPSKQRQIIMLDTEKSVISQIKMLLQNKIQIGSIRSSEKLVDMLRKSSQQGENIEMMRCYMLSGIAKLNSVKQYLSQILQNDVKIIVFAHHKAVMDQLQTHLKTNKFLYIRLDGEITPENRKKKVDLFQQDSNIRVALLSLTAMGMGFTLTAASTVIFAQLHWTPAVLIQAEDRCHRIGQKNAVNIHYLIGDQTLDPIMLRQLERKVGTVSMVLDGQDDKMNIQILPKGQMGTFEIQSQQKASKGSKITDYFAPVKTKKEKQQLIEHNQSFRSRTQEMQDQKGEDIIRLQQIVEDIRSFEKCQDSDESFMIQFARNKKITHNIVNQKYAKSTKKQQALVSQTHSFENIKATGKNNVLQIESNKQKHLRILDQKLTNKSEVQQVITIDIDNQQINQESDESLLLQFARKKRNKFRIE